MRRHLRLGYRQHLMRLEEVGMHGRQRNQIGHGAEPLHLHAMCRQQPPIPGRALPVPACDVDHGLDKAGIGTFIGQIRRLLSTKMLDAFGHCRGIW